MTVEKKKVLHLAFYSVYWQAVKETERETVKMVFGHYWSITEASSWLQLLPSDLIMFDNRVVEMLSL